MSGHISLINNGCKICAESWADFINKIQQNIYVLLTVSFPMFCVNKKKTVDEKRVVLAKSFIRVNRLTG